MLTFFEVAIGEGGPLSCSACASPKAAEPHGLAEVRPRLAKAVAKATSDGERNVLFVGFEPFAHPALPRLVSVAAELGFRRIGVRTDAGALSMPGNASGVLGAGVRHFQVVLLGDQETHDRLSGREGLHAAAIEGATTLKTTAEKVGAEIFISGTMPLCKHNLSVAPGAVVSFAASGCRAVELDAGGVAVDEQARRVLEAALDTATINGMHPWVTGCDGFPAPYDRAPWTVAEVSE